MVSSSPSWYVPIGLLVTSWPKVRSSIHHAVSFGKSSNLMNTLANKSSPGAPEVGLSVSGAIGDFVEGAKVPASTGEAMDGAKVPVSVGEEMDGAKVDGVGNVGAGAVGAGSVGGEGEGSFFDFCIPQKISDLLDILPF